MNKIKPEDEFHAGQKVEFLHPIWDEKTESVKKVSISGTIQYSYNFKKTARVHYFDPFDGQPTHKELPFSKLKPVYE